MSYLGYEISAGDCIADVQSLCRHVARAQGATFNASTVPNLAAVERWLTQSYYWIGGVMRRAGLSDTQTAARVIGWLEQLQVYDVACRVELSLPAENTTGEPNQRFQTFEERRAELLEGIKDGTVAGLGATAYATGLRVPIVTGLFKSRKRVAEADTDRTQHRVRRDGFANPSSSNVSSETDYNTP